MKKKNLFKRDFMWYYTTILFVLGTLVNFVDWIDYNDSASMLAIVIALPTIFWLFQKSE